MAAFFFSPFLVRTIFALTAVHRLKLALTINTENFYIFLRESDKTVLKAAMRIIASQILTLFLFIWKRIQGVTDQSRFMARYEYLLKPFL